MKYKHGDVRDDGFIFRRYALDKRDMTIREVWRDPNKMKEARKRQYEIAQNNGKNKEYRLKQKYGLTLEKYNNMLNEQQHQCAICSQPLDIADVSGRHKGRKPHVDHCHNTGRVRGILCYKCNVGLGSFEDNPKTLAKAIAYLSE